MKRILSIFFCLFVIVGVTSCNNTNSSQSSQTEKVDYTAQVKLDMNSSSKKEKVTLKTCIDGDTTHFYSTITADGVVKARYLAIDTPESTGKVQAWGKAAASFNKDILTKAESIYIESNDDKWNVDSTNERYLLFVWYRSSAEADYRMLNLELMQEGYAAAKNYASTKYGDAFQKAYNQAISLKLHYYGTEKDPGFDYGNYTPMTLRGIRESILYYASHTEENEEIYNCVNANVRFEGLITYDAGGNVYYVEDYDEETEMSYGMQVYTGYNFTGVDLLKVGNLVSFAATITYSENFGYQASGLNYFVMRPDNEKNIRLISTGNEVKPSVVSGTAFVNNGAKIIDTYVKMTSLTVQSIYTTKNESSSSVGAMTLTCKSSDDKVITVRTSVLYEADGETMITASKYEGKTIDIVGVVDEFDGAYQVHVYSDSHITIH